jgi:hypothetical protein
MFRAGIMSALEKENNTNFFFSRRQQPVLLCDCNTNTNQHDITTLICNSALMKRKTSCSKENKYLIA